MLNDKIVITVLSPEPKEVELFMSYAQLTALSTIIGDDVGRIGGLDLDPVLGDAVLTSLLAPRARGGRPPVTAPVDWDIPDMSQADAAAAFDWCKSHLLGFFLSRLEKTAELLKVNAERMQKVGLSLNGTVPEASKTL